MRRWALRLIVGLLLAAWLLTGVKEIRPGERAVIRRFGRVLDVQPRAGLWIGLPAGIDRVDRVPVEQVRRVAVGYRPGDDVGDEAPSGQLLTGDRNLVNVRIVLNYAVDPELVVEFVEQQERIEELMARTAEAALAEWVAGRPVDDVLLRGKTLLPKDLPERLQPRLDAAGLGVRLRGMDVAYLSPPDEVRPAFDGVAQAEADRKKMEQQARQQTLQRESEVSAEIRKLDLDGDAYARIRLEQARAEAAAFEERVSVYRGNPLVREAGRWTHFLKQVRRLAENGQLQPLDPAIDSPLRK
jgi:membrane protease subunit HflK